MSARSTPARDLLARLDAVERRLEAHAARDDHRGLTRADPKTGERWERGQVWAHLAEFVPYWMAEVRKVLAAPSTGPVPFGRIKTDPGRVGYIAEHRGEPPAAQLGRTKAGIRDLREWLRGLPDQAWAARGIHQTRGVMALEQIVDEFMVGHLDEHAAQLDELAPGGPGYEEAARARG
jgi:hypothetical protein